MFADHLWHHDCARGTNSNVQNETNRMSENKRARNWMKIPTRAMPTPADRVYRQVGIEDVATIARLMDRSYQGTIDHQGETLEQCADEIRSTLTGKYGAFFDFASFGIFESGKALSASLVTFWKEKPLLAFSMTDPDAQKNGHARFLIERSISALAERGYSEFYLVVTEGNTSAERLYRRLGFEFLGPALPEGPPPTQ